MGRARPTCQFATAGENPRAGPRSPRVDRQDGAYYHSRMTPSDPSLAAQALDLFRRWIGWGWGLALLLWLLGAIVILTTVQRYFLERTGSRRMTIVIFVVWGLAVIGAASRFFGFGPPGGHRAAAGPLINNGSARGTESSMSAIETASPSIAVRGGIPKRSSANRRIEEKSRTW